LPSFERFQKRRSISWDDNPRVTGGKLREEEKARKKTERRV